MKFNIFNKFSSLSYGLSESTDGFMNTKKRISDEEQAKAKKNREEFANKKKIDLGKMSILHLVHGDNIVIPSVDNLKKQTSFEADGIITDKKGYFLGLTVADCFPIFIYDSEKQIIALVHAGWRGVEKNIAGKTIDELVSDFGSDPKNIFVGIGPGIGQCHFQVDKPLMLRLKSISEIPDESQFIKKEGDKYKISLGEIILSQIKRKGVPKENAESVNECTYCEEKYLSFRRQKTKTDDGQIVPRVMLAHMGQK